MASLHVSGVFDTVDSAERARADLLEEGIEGQRISLSALQTDDGIAAESPGHTFENQPGQTGKSSAAARYGAAVRTGSCVLTVHAHSSAERERSSELMRACGAREIASPPG